MTRSRSNWTGVAFGFTLACFAAYQQFKLPPVLPILLETYHYDRTLAGGFMSIYAVAGLLFSVLFGRLLALRGAVAPTLGALALSVVGSGLVLAVPDNGWVVLGGRALEGVGFAFLAICGHLLANMNASARNLPLVVGLMAAWIPIGQLSAILLAQVAFAWHGWQVLWIVAICGALIMAAWALGLRRGPALRVPAVSESSAHPPSETLGGRRRLSLVLAAGVFMLWSGQYFAYMTWLPQYLVEVYGLSVAGAALGNMVPVAVLIATTIAIGMVLRAGVAVGPLLVCGLALQAVIWWLIPVTGAGLGGLVSLTLYGLAAGICPACLFTMPTIVAGQGRAAAPAFGVVMTGRNIGVLIGPVLLAQAFKLAGAWNVVAPIFGALTTVAVGLGIWLSVSLAGARYGIRR